MNLYHSSKELAEALEPDEEADEYLARLKRDVKDVIMNTQQTFKRLEMTNLLARKRRGLAGSEAKCSDCKMKVLADEQDEFCPWCEERRRKEADSG